MKKLVLLTVFLFASATWSFADTAPTVSPTPPAGAAATTVPAGLIGVWYAIIGGTTNRLIFRIAGFPSDYTATTDSVDQGLVALPTGIAMDADNNVTIKIGEMPPLEFTGKLKDETIVGKWTEDTHTGSMTLVKNDQASGFPATQPIPHLAGNWEGVRSGIAFHFIFHISGSPESYHATADSIDQNALGLNAGVKIDAMDNVFLSIGFQHPLYFTGFISGDRIVGTWSQGGGMGEMTLNRLR